MHASVHQTTKITLKFYCQFYRNANKHTTLSITCVLRRVPVLFFCTQFFSLYISYLFMFAFHTFLTKKLCMFYLLVVNRVRTRRSRFQHTRNKQIEHGNSSCSRWIDQQQHHTAENWFFFHLTKAWFAGRKERRIRCIYMLKMKKSERRRICHYF